MLLALVIGPVGHQLWGSDTRFHTFTPTTTISPPSRITPADFRWFPMAFARPAAHRELSLVSNGASAPWRRPAPPSAPWRRPAPPLEPVQ
jgi:hypothetical protein